MSGARWFSAGPFEKWCARNITYFTYFYAKIFLRNRVLYASNNLENNKDYQKFSNCNALLTYHILHHVWFTCLLAWSWQVVMPFWATGSCFFELPEIASFSYIFLWHLTDCRTIRHLLNDSYMSIINQSPVSPLRQNSRKKLFLLEISPIIKHCFLFCRLRRHCCCDSPRQRYLSSALQISWGHRDLGENN